MSAEKISVNQQRYSYTTPGAINVYRSAVGTAIAKIHSVPIEGEPGTGIIAEWVIYVNTGKFQTNVPLNLEFVRPATVKEIYQAEEILSAPKSVADDISKISASISSLLQYKNNKYGNSALEPLNIFGNKAKAGPRLDEKLARVKNSTTLAKNDVADCIGYLYLICVEKGWTDFEDQKD